MFEATRGFLVRRKRDLQYLRYLARHKYHVACACLQHGRWLHAITHDLSKLLPSEWGPYREYFYTPGGPGGSGGPLVESFNRAWLAHQKRNRHHWQAWILIPDDGGPARPLPMSRDAMLEMVCDWYGAGKAIHGHERGWQATRQWFVQNIESIKLHETTRRAVLIALCYLEAKEAAFQLPSGGTGIPPPVKRVRPVTEPAPTPDLDEEGER